MNITLLEKAEAQAKWAELLEAAAGGESDIVIIRSGEPMTVMIRYEDYLAVLDELEDARLARRAIAVLAALDRLAENPRHLGVIKLQGYSEL